MALCHALLCSQHPRPLENEWWPLVALATPHTTSQRRLLHSRPPWPATFCWLLQFQCKYQRVYMTLTLISPVSLACRRPWLWCQAIQVMSDSKITFVLVFYWDRLIWFWGNPWQHKRQCCNFSQMGLKHISFPSKSNDSLIKIWSLCSPTPTAATSTIPSRMEITLQQCHCTPGNLIPQSFLLRTELNCCRLALGIEKPGSSTVPGVVNCKIT